MSMGFRTFKPNGDLDVDTRFALVRFLGTAFVPKPTGNATGSITHAGLSTGTPYWRINGTTTNFIITPNIYVSGNTLTWEYNFDQIGGVAVATAGILSDITIVFGVY